MLSVKYIPHADTACNCRESQRARCEFGIIEVYNVHYRLYAIKKNIHKSTDPALRTIPLDAPPTSYMLC